MKSIYLRKKMLVACRRTVVATLLVIVALFSSCTGLTESPYTFVDPGNYYKSEEELESALNSVYADFRNFASNYKTLMILELVTEHAMPAHASKDGVISFNCWQGVNQATTYNIQIWDSGYEMINRCNVVLGRGDGVNMSDEKRNQIYGQARFFRAYTMFVLLRLYGGLAIPESYTVGLDGLEIPRNTVDETYDFIIQDLEYCIANLPTRSLWGSGSYYKASKGAAQALLGDVYLTRGCMDNNNTVYFQEAKKQLGDVINSGEYELLPDYKSLWYWFVEEASKNTKESLLEVQFGPTQVSSLHCNFGINVTDESLGGKMYHRSAISHKDYLSYQDNDVRKQCFLTEYTITGTDTRRYFEPEYKGFSGKGEGKWPSSAPGNMKFYDRTKSCYETGGSKANLIAIRYSDVLLNYAEVENYLNGPTSDAYEKLNKVHQRSLSIPVTPGLSKEEFDDAIYQERTWELVGEGYLYFDELRTDRLGKNVYEYKTYMYENGYFNCQKLQFVPQKTFLWKIPQTSLDSNPALEQNPDNISDPRYPLK